MNATIPVPDFREMTDADLHAWEFTVYEKTPDLSGDLDEIVGVDVALRYYRERGRRVDLELRKSTLDQLFVLNRDLNEILGRLKANSSGEFHYGRTAPPNPKE